MPTSPKMQATSPQINQDAMQVLEDLLASSPPNADKTYAQLVAEEERRRMLAIIQHRIKVTF